MLEKRRLLELLSSCRFARIGLSEWNLLRTQFPGISEASMRGWLRESGVPVQQPYAGIGTKTLEQLEESLSQMACVYREDIEMRQTCRALVIQAKDRARFAAKNARAPFEKRALKEEMVQWMLVWLDDPTMFENWVALRKRSGDIRKLPS